MASGIIFSLKLGKTHRRRTIKLTFPSIAATSVPLFYVQIATNSITMLNVHANQSFVDINNTEQQH